MNLPENLVAEFVKATNDNIRFVPPTTLKGTVVVYQGVTYAKLDGANSDILTPVSSTVEVSDGDEVTVEVGNHSAIITGNLTSPAATGDSVDQRLDIFLGVVDGQIVAKVQASEDKLSRLIISEDAIRTLVSTAVDDSETGMRQTISSSIEQLAKSITLSVSNGSSSSTITLSGDNIKTQSKTISFSGVVTFSELNSRGYSTLSLSDVRSDLQSRWTTTTINGADIQTGTINAATVVLEGEEYDYTENTWKGGGVKAGQGNDGTSRTYGAKLYGYGEEYYCLATNAGVGLFKKSPGSGKASAFLYLAGTSLVGSAAIANKSDRRLKKDISDDLRSYEVFFSKLVPVKFKYIDGTSNRFHTGFIAQDVEQALFDSGLTTQDLAAFIAEEMRDGSIEYSLRYSEFISLNTYMIQKANERIAKLEQEVQELKQLLLKEGGET